MPVAWAASAEAPSTATQISKSMRFIGSFPFVSVVSPPRVPAPLGGVPGPGVASLIHDGPPRELRDGPSVYPTVMRLTPHHLDRSMPERKADPRADVQLIRQTLARVLQL